MRRNGTLAMTTNDRKSRHRALLRDVARLISQPADSLAVRLVALARLKMDATEAALLSGDPTVTIGDITALEEVFAKYVPKAPLAVQVTYVHPTTKCPQCQHEFNLDLPDKDDNGSPVQAANAKPLVDDPYKPADQTPPKAPGSIVAAVPGAAAMSRPQVIDLEQQRTDRSLQLRDEALTNNHFALKRNQPSIGAPFSDNESPVPLSRRIDAAYR